LGLESRVRLLGFRNDVPDLLRMADVFAFSSLWEAMGRSMVEAMLLGRPVVAPAIYGIPEIVHHQQTGLLYDVGNVEQLAAHLTHLLKHPEERRRLGQNARQLTRSLFDVSNMVAQIEHVYEQLLQTESVRGASTAVAARNSVEPASVLSTQRR
jgi:glycosyltransferase involved in cell wall biosynthesis